MPPIPVPQGRLHVSLRLYQHPQRLFITANFAWQKIRCHSIVHRSIVLIECCFHQTTSMDSSIGNVFKATGSVILQDRLPFMDGIGNYLKGALESHFPPSGPGCHIFDDCGPLELGSVMMSLEVLGRPNNAAQHTGRYEDRLEMPLKEAWVSVHMREVPGMAQSALRDALKLTNFRQRFIFMHPEALPPSQGRSESASVTPCGLLSST